jgi:hypothetical protein
MDKPVEDKLLSSRVGLWKALYPIHGWSGFLLKNDPRCGLSLFNSSSTWDISEFIPLMEFKYCLEK